MPLPDFTQPFDKRQIAGKIGLVEVGMLVPPVIFRQSRGTLPRHRPGEQPGSHRRIDNHADPFAQAKWQGVLFNFPVNQRIGRLQRGYRRNGLASLQLVDVKVRNPDPAHFADALQLAELRPPFLELGRIRVGGPMNLVEIDDIHAEAAQAGLDFALDGIGMQASVKHALFVPEAAAFGENIGPRTAP